MCIRRDPSRMAAKVMIVRPSGHTTTDARVAGVALTEASVATTPPERVQRIGAIPSYKLSTERARDSATAGTIGCGQ